MSDTAEVWTVGRLLNWTTDYLGEHGSESARLDAEVLLAEARRCDRIDLYTAFDEAADEQTRVAFRELVRRRAEGTPVAYLVGRREFYSMTFQVTPDVLIPRPETEFVVVALLDLVKQMPADQPLQIADVGTGSGILAVCAAKHIPQCHVTAVDQSVEALEVARRNAKLHEVADRVQLVESDLLTDVPTDVKFDIVISNPPYVSQEEFDKLAPGVRLQEPRAALLAGVLGTEVIERLVPQAAERTPVGGNLLVEISPFIEQDVRGILDSSVDWELVNVVKDLAALPRVVHARRV